MTTNSQPKKRRRTDKERAVNGCMRVLCKYELNSHNQRLFIMNYGYIQYHQDNLSLGAIALLIQNDFDSFMQYIRSKEADGTLVVKNPKNV